jgi:lipoprotein-anchoring transpeptidase ErfK/SrfK
MRRICMSALLTSALLSPAFAQVGYSPYTANQPGYVAQQPAPAPVVGQQYYVYVPQQAYAAPAPSYDGAAPRGLVAAPQSYAAPVPSYTPSTAPRYAAAPPQTYVAPAPQTYASAAPQTYVAPTAPPPSSTGTVAQRYAAAAGPDYTGTIASSYAAPAPPPPPPAPPAPAGSGGGFLAAIFGGPTIQAHVYQPRMFQPAQPEYQASPEPQATVVSAPTSYAPSSHGDMSSYPIDPKYDRTVVDYRGEEKPGTVIIDTPNKFLYLVESGGKALRYGIGVGRPGFTWAGVKTITAKKEWPDWRPPSDMLARRPDLPRYMPGGMDNPLGARAMYLGSTLYRIHGSNEPWTIGTNVSSGCIRMRNEDVIDLYGRVNVGARVVVI